MSGAEETSPLRAEWAGLGEAVPAAAAPRRRLFRKYALIFIALVGAALLINSGFDFWFSYQENKAALVRVQQEKAEAAAQRIAEFVEEIKSQIGWTTHAQWAAGPLDQRRQDYVRLLRQVPAITELRQLDGEGKERLLSSRLAMDVSDSGADFSESPAFIEAKAHKVWFSPVYFRKESEPYMSLAMRLDGKNAGVTVADINLKLIWDVITALKIGQGGYAYVVDGRGRLIAHPDISLVLRDTDLSRLPQVAAALNPQPGQAAVMTADNLAGHSVLTAHAAIPQLGWRVFVEVPLAEAFAPLYGAALRTIVLLVFGLIAATLVALVIARRMTGPIHAIAAGAERLGAGDLGRRIEIHTGDEIEGLAQQFNRMAADLQRSYAELEQRVADRTAELSEALDQQTATAEVLGVINSSPGDLAPVFGAILEKALTLCDAAHGHLWTYDGDLAHPVAARGEPKFVEWLSGRGPIRPGPFSPVGRILRGERVVHVADIHTDESYSKQARFRELVEVGGVRTMLDVALVNEGAVLGMIAIYRKEVRPFSDKQIALLQNFAAQAVIAMENARLITETREALEQQTATAEVLGVINSSPGDLAPVFDALLEKAMRLCDVAFGGLQTYDGEFFHLVADRGDPRFAERVRRLGPLRAEPGTTNERLVRDEDVVQVADIAADEGYRPGNVLRAALVEAGGYHTMLSVALRKDGRVLGAIHLRRREVRLFSDKQIALVQNFAAQAVIAMENARLITETQEALEQQTATAEVLGVINSSPGDLAPVFDAMLEKAMRLCGAAFGSLWTYRGDRFGPVAHHGLPAAYAEYLSRGEIPAAGQGTGRARLLAGERFAHIADLADEPPYRDGEPHRRALVELGGARTALLVPLRKDDAVSGFIMIYRQEVRPFTDKQIALLQNFAVQAVIAMENARLITETREALEQQTATAEVLGVINSSPGDLAPVFDAMLDKALRLCDANLGTLYTFDGGAFHSVGHCGVSAALSDFLREPIKIGNFPDDFPKGSLGALMAGESVVHEADIADTEAYRIGYPLRRALVDLDGARTGLWVALRKDRNLLGTFVIYRKEVRPFSDKQIALLQNFAAQAVIAMENARLITETREALEQQTATAEVLGVINSSPGDLAPVFDAMLERALRFCDAASGHLYTYDGGLFHPTVMRGDPEFSEWWHRHGPVKAVPGGGFLGHILLGEPVVSIADVKETAGYREVPDFKTLVDRSGLRSGVGVALRNDAGLRGAITIYRQEVKPFSDKQIALLQNFAAQAVIAMENARLITETREALEQQTATAEVLGVINSSPGDLAPVFDAILEKATDLCEAAFGVLWTREEELFRAAALRGVPPDYAEFVTREPRGGRPGGALQHLVDGAPLVHIPETDLARADPTARTLAELGGIKTLLAVPLRKDGNLLGGFTIYRQEVRPFSDKQIALLQNFAAQAVIAMENARLITETREALEQQTATAEVLGVINSSPGDLAPVFDAILEKAHSLCGAEFGALITYDGDRFRTVTAHGTSGVFKEVMKDGFRPESGGDPFARILAGEPLVHVADLNEVAAQVGPDQLPLLDVAVKAGIRTQLVVPLRKDEKLLGVITANRREVRPFSDKQIALLQNFAAQAVIAMENARLITETREALDQQTATAEVLGVINASPGDLAPVFDAILEKAQSLCGAVFGLLFTFDGEHINTAALHNIPEGFAEFLRRGPVKPAPETTLARVIEERRPTQIADVMVEDPYRRGDPFAVTAVNAAGVRTVLSIPLVKDNAVLGVIGLFRQEVRPFTDKQIALLENFAAQAVIAMENARLITETRERTRDLQESLEYQTATSDVLKVISQSTFDLEPVLQTVVDTAMRLCGNIQGSLFRLGDDGLYRQAVASGVEPEYYAIEAAQAIPPGPGTLVGRTALARQPVHITDAWADPDYAPKDDARVGGLRSMLGVPLMRGGEPIGVICTARTTVEPFTDKQIELVRTFADQAVIAIENARLLNELRGRTRDLQESLEYQTATSDVLKVISQSVFDLDTMLQTVVATAVRLCRADTAIIYRNEGGEYRWAAGQLVAPEYEARERAISIRPGTGTVVGRAALERRTVHILDAWTDPLYEAKEDARIGGVHSMIGVPLLREGVPIGAIALARQRVEAFSEKEIALVTTFADQAVIAIENARLLNELRERTDELAHSVEELKALAEVGQAVSSTLDLGAILSTVLNRSVGLTAADAGVIFRYSQNRRAFRFIEAVGWDAGLVRQVRQMHIDQNMTLMGDAVARRAPTQIIDLRERPSNMLRDATLAAGYRSVLIVPLVGADRIFGALLLHRRRPGEFPEATVRLMQTLAAQSVLAIQNAGLFREIADKSEQLALASQHKSQFLANMSHELRTPLNAILGYAELLVDGIYGAVPEKAMAVLERVQNNGKHLLALINDVLDLSKIEAGQLVLTLEDYALADVVQSVVTATEALASTKGLRMSATVAPGLPTGHGDARRLSQVLLNLVGNALKFTDEGEVAIGAGAENGHFVLTVRDTGPGIAPEDQDKIFGEFQQVDNSNTRKKGGTGLGLAISKRMVEMQGGSIAVESALGHGATFRVTLPIRVEEAADELSGELMGAA